MKRHLLLRGVQGKEAGQGHHGNMNASAWANCATQQHPVGAHLPAPATALPALTAVHVSKGEDHFVEALRNELRHLSRGGTQRLEALQVGHLHACRKKRLR